MVLSSLWLVSCGQPVRPAVMARVEASLNSPETQEAKDKSPITFGRAESLRFRAEMFGRSGDVLAAELTGEHAIAAYARTIAMAKRSEATSRASLAKQGKLEATQAFEADEASRLEQDRDADKIETAVTVRRDALYPASSAPTDGARTTARWSAVRTNIAMADAMCEGARLLAETGKFGGEARKGLADLRSANKDGLRDSRGEAPIDGSVRVRALCLKALAAAREYKVATGGVRGDVLVEEIAKIAGVAAGRDERGVVASLAADTFDVDKLSKLGRERAGALGTLAKSHREAGWSFALVVLVHGADPKRDVKRGEWIREGLIAAGADPAKISVKTPGTALPAFDPMEPKLKAKNERVEVIFVGGLR